jgi:hypothetical protein
MLNISPVFYLSSNRAPQKDPIVWLPDRKPREKMNNNLKNKRRNSTTNQNPFQFYSAGVPVPDF